VKWRGPSPAGHIFARTAAFASSCRWGGSCAVVTPASTSHAEEKSSKANPVVSVSPPARMRGCLGLSRDRLGGRGGPRSRREWFWCFSGAFRYAPCRCLGCRRFRCAGHDLNLLRVFRRFVAPSPPQAPSVRPAGAAAARGSEVGTGGFAHARSPHAGSPVDCYGLLGSSGKPSFSTPGEFYRGLSDPDFKALSVDCFRGGDHPVASGD
jgi:hypothetical protein